MICTALVETQVKRKSRRLGFPIFIPIILTFCFIAGCATPPKEPVHEDIGSGKEPLTEAPSTVEPSPEGPTPEERRQKEETEAITAIEGFMQNGEIDKAITTFEKTFLGDGDIGADTLLMYGLLLISGGDFDQAGEVLDRAAETDPDNTEVLYNLSLIEGAKGNTEKQRELLEKIIARIPDHVEAQTSLGHIYLADKKTKQAKEAFEAAMKYDDTFLPARMGYAGILLQDEEFDEAESELDRVIESNPNYTLAYVDRSRARLAQKNREGAIDDLTTAIELDPDDFWNYLDRGRIYLFLGKTRPAADDFSKAIELDSDNFYPYAYRAGIREQLGDAEGAISDYERIVSLRKDYYFAYSALGILYYMQEDWFDAAIAFGNAYVYEDDIFPYAVLAVISMFRDGKENEGREFINEVIERIPGNSIYNHLMRLFLDKKYEGHFLVKIEEIKDKQEKARALFYLASYYAMQNQYRLSQTYFLEVTARLSPGEIEYRLASWEIDDDFE